QQVLLPVRKTGALRHARADERNHKSTLAGSLQCLEHLQIVAELVAVQYLCLLLLVEPPGFLIVEVAVTEVEGTAGLGEWNLLLAAFANDLNVLELLIVDDLVEAPVLADAREFLESGFMIKGRL